MLRTTSKTTQAQDPVPLWNFSKALGKDICFLVICANVLHNAHGRFAMVAVVQTTNSYPVDPAHVSQGWGIAGFSGLVVLKGRQFDSPLQDGLQKVQ